jgi:hypothetical protein
MMKWWVVNEAPLATHSPFKYKRIKGEGEKKRRGADAPLRRPACRHYLKHNNIV